MYREQVRTLKIVHGFTDSVIKMRREKILGGAVEIDEEKKKCLLDMLLHATIDGQPLTNADIREEVDTFMFEGHDTTTSGIAFTLYHLSRHPEIQQKVYEELVEVLEKGDADSYLDLPPGTQVSGDGGQGVTEDNTLRAFYGSRTHGRHALRWSADPQGDTGQH